MSEGSLSQLDDLEIYLECSDLDAILGWLQQHLPHFRETRRSRKGCRFQCGTGDLSSKGMVVLNAGNTGFTSVWIDSKDTPWDDDVAMGRSAQKALGGAVRCVESAWTQGDDPDRWLQIDGTGEQIIQWVTEEP
ncbi:MAG: hypothetical protein CML06_09790 [Pseudomonadales bacterium]|nr:hypothetical protein [Pseudomonadales bacterium]